MAETPPDTGAGGPIKSPATEGRADSLERRQAAYKFFSDLVLGAGAKQLRKEWDDARNNYEDDPENLFLVNLWRAKVDTQASFLDNEPAVLRFTVPTAHTDDDASDMRMKCEQAVYDYIHREMGYSKKLDRMRHSADVTNVGFVAHQPDIEKWLPDLVYLEPEQVAIDAACGADMGKAGWVAYSQFSSPDELHAQYTEVPLRTFTLAAAKKGFVVPFSDDAEAEAARGRLNDTHGASGDLKQCRVWRVYARGAYALYDKPPDEEGQGQGGTGDAKRPGAEFDAGQGEARRYLFLVEGVDVPLVDIMEWPRPLLLDKDEWPITKLSYNRARKSVYGFPDYRQERSLLKEIERVVRDIASRHAMEGLKVGTMQGAVGLGEEAVKTFLEGKGIQVLPNLFDSQGNPKLRVLELPPLTQDDLTYLTTLIELYDQISMQPRATRGNEDPEKTATATQVETDMATGRANRRLRRFEEALAEVAKKMMQMAHAMLPQVTELGLPGEEMLAQLPYAEAESLLMEPGVELVRLGVEAIAGAEMAAHWRELPDNDDAPGFVAMLLRSVRITVEHGSTQRHVRLQKVASFRQVFAEVILPAVQALGAPRALVESVKKMLTMLGLDEFESIAKELDAVLEAAEAAQAAAAAQAEQAAAVPAGAPAVG